MILALLFGCGDDPVRRPDAADDYNFRQRCIQDADIPYCLERAKEDPLSDRARHAYALACDAKHPGACAHFVRTFHEREPKTAIRFAASECAVNGDLCGEFQNFELLYPQFKSQLQRARAYIDKARAAKAASP